MSDRIPSDRRAEILEVFQIYIAYIRHENDLIHQRAARFLGIQAALFAVVGLVLQKYLEIAINDVDAALAGPAAPVYLFLAGLSGIGVLSCRSALTSLSAADKAQSRLDESYRSIESGHFKKDADLLGLPELRGGGNPTLSADGSKFLLWLPKGIAVFWFFLFSVVLAAFIYAVVQTDVWGLVWGGTIKERTGWLGAVLVSVGSSVLSTMIILAFFVRR